MAEAAEVAGGTPFTPAATAPVGEQPVVTTPTEQVTPQFAVTVTRVKTL